MIVKSINIFISALLTFSLVTITLFYCGYGFDFTDEGFQLIWVSDPNRYKILVPVSFFGFFYNPIFNILNGDIVMLRRFNVFFVFGLAFILSMSVLRICFRKPDRRNTDFVLLSAALAATSLAYFFNLWIVTPSYNSLVFQGMLVTFIGLFFTVSGVQRAIVIGWICIGFGGAIVFLAKPSTAALLGPSVIACQLASGRGHWKMLVSAGLASVITILAFIFLIDWGVNDFAEAIVDGITFLKLLGSGQEFGKIFRVDTFNPTSREMVFLFALLIIMVVAFISNPLSKIRFCLDIFMFLLAISSIAYLFWPGAPLIGVRGTVIVALPIAAIFAALIISRGKLSEPRKFLPLAILLLAAPHIYAFGTNGNYWSRGSAVMLFWGLSAVVFLAPLIGQHASLKDLRTPVIVMQFVLVSLLLKAVAAPYRQEAFDRKSFVAWDLREHGQIMVSEKTRKYLAQARSVASQAGVSPGDNMIDLTGRSPGLLYDLQVVSLGQPWQVGGYPGSKALAIASLREESCESLSRAWLLTEPDGPRHLAADEVVRSFGASLQTDYQVVDSIQTSSNAGGFKSSFAQHLLKPLRDADSSVEACLLARSVSNQVEKDRSRL